MARAEPLTVLALEPGDGRQELLGGDRAVPGLWRHQAGVAVAARLAGLAEVGEDLHPSALDRLAQREHRVEVRAQASPVRGVAVRGVDHPTLLDDVLETVCEPGGRRQAVAARPPGLLVVALHGLGQVQVGDEADVRLVDTHAERDGGHHHEAVLAQESGLVGGAHARVQTGVVRQGGDPLIHEVLRRLLDRGARQAVDDARVTRVLGAQQVEELGPGVVLRCDPVLDVRPVEAGHEVPRVGQLQALRDLGVGRRGGRRGEGDPGDVGPALVQHGQLEVVGPEVVAPLRHAVRLVDGEQRDPAAVEQVHRAGHPQSFRCEVEQVELAGHEGRLDAAARGRVLGRVEEAGPHPERGQRVDLVLHQRDQRRDDDADPRAHERRDLIAQRLAAAGRHQHQRVAARHHRVDDLRLVAAELAVPEHAPEHVERRRSGVGRARRAARSRDRQTRHPRGRAVRGRRARQVVVVRVHRGFVIPGVVRRLVVVRVLSRIHDPTLRAPGVRPVCPSTAFRRFRPRRALRAPRSSARVPWR